MELSSNMIAELVKVTKAEPPKSSGNTVYGTVKVYDEKNHVQIDGSDLYTPVNTTTDVKEGDRVMVLIKDHKAVVTGNLSDKSVGSERVKEVENAVSYKVTADELDVITATIENLKATVGTFDDLSAEELEAVTATIENLEAKYATLEFVSVNEVKALIADIDTLKATIASFGSVSTEKLEAANAYIEELRGDTASFTFVLADIIAAQKASIKELETSKLDASFANLDIANMDIAKIGELYAKSGIIKDVVTENGTVTGELVGVTIRGDLIQGNTIVADALVIRGEDGLYYKLNTEGVEPETYIEGYVLTGGTIDPIIGTTLEDVQIIVDVHCITSSTGVDYCEINGVCYRLEIVDNETYNITDTIYVDQYPESATVDTSHVLPTACQVYSYNSADGSKAYYCRANNSYYEVTFDPHATEIQQDEYNSLNGKKILAHSITATQISVSDLVAFDATIGGFKIGDNFISTVTKTDVDNTARGFYVDNDGQFVIGDSKNFIKFYKKDTDEYVLDISASSLRFDLSEALDALTERVKIGGYEDMSTAYQVYSYIKEDNSTGYYCIVDSLYYSVEYDSETSKYSKTNAIISAVDGTVVDGIFTTPDILPSIELSEDDSEFKQIITNKGAIYSNGSKDLTKIDNTGIETDNLVLRGDYTQQNWSWQVDTDGGLGLVWIGGTD